VTRWWAHAGEERLKEMSERLPLKHSITPEQVASTTLELLTNEAITGQIVALDSGGLLP
jgi:hypothetical protein